jgi:hypothetical protein
MECLTMANSGAPPAMAAPSPLATCPPRLDKPTNMFSHAHRCSGLLGRSAHLRQGCRVLRTRQPGAKSAEGLKRARDNPASNNAKQQQPGASRHRTSSRCVPHTLKVRVGVAARTAQPAAVSTPAGSLP